MTDQHNLFFKIFTTISKILALILSMYFIIVGFCSIKYDFPFIYYSEEKTILVSNNSRIVEEEWKRFQFTDINRVCHSSYQRIICDREFVGFECYKYNLNTVIHIHNVICNNNGTAKLNPIYHVWDSETNHHYSINRPYRKTITTRELFVDPKNVTPELLNNFFKFNETRDAQCSAQIINLNSKGLYFSVLNSGEGIKKEQICSSLDELIFRNITYDPIYKKEIYITIPLYGTFNIVLILAYCAIFQLIFLNMIFEKYYGKL